MHCTHFALQKLIRRAATFIWKEVVCSLHPQQLFHAKPQNWDVIHDVLFTAEDVAQETREQPLQQLLSCFLLVHVKTQEIRKVLSVGLLKDELN